MKKLIPIIVSIFILQPDLFAQDYRVAAYFSPELYHFGDDFPAAYGFGVDMSFPVRDFVVGFGIRKTNVGKIWYPQFTGESEVELENGEVHKYNLFFEQHYYLKYYSIPVHLKYYLLDDFIFLKTAAVVNIQDRHNHVEVLNKSRTEVAPYEFNDSYVKSINFSGEIGIGFSMGVTDHLNVWVLPLFVYYLNPTKRENLVYNSDIKRLRLSAGVEFLF